MATAISRDDAIATVQSQAATDVPPTLTDDQVAGLVDRSARMDTDGNTVDSDDWTPTYCLNAATALAWERKAALTSGRFDLTIDGQTLRRSQVYDMCMAEAKRYRARILSTMSRQPPTDPAHAL